MIWYQLLTGDLALLHIPPDWQWIVRQRGLGEEQIKLLDSCIASRQDKRLASAAVLAEHLDSLLKQAPEPSVKAQEPSQEDEQLNSDWSEYQGFASAERETDYLTSAAPVRLNAWRAAAAGGSPIGQCFFGMCLREGIGVAQDHTEAVRWLRKAADQGYAAGQRNLGGMFKQGGGVAQDDVEAVRKLSHCPPAPGNWRTSMSPFPEFLRQRLESGGFAAEDALASFLPVLRQTAAAHQAGLVAPLHGTNDLHVENGRLWFEEARRQQPRLNVQLVRSLEQPAGRGVEVVGEFGITSDVDSGEEAVASLQIGKRGEAIIQPVYLPGYVCWEHEVGHHDPLTDVFSLGLILASLTCGLDLDHPEDLTAFVRHRANLFDLNPSLHPVLAKTVVRMTELVRQRRPQDLAGLLHSLENYRQQPALPSAVPSSSPAGPKATVATPPAPPRPPVVPRPTPQVTAAAAVPAAPAAESHSIDRPACFYLGREYDLATKKVLQDKLIMYDARNLTTHGVIVGMMASGKTGLAIAILEEAAIDGIPAVIIDPKGDLTNLLLQFPDLSPKRFAEWLNPEDARFKNLTVDAYAKQLSERWRQGLLDSKQAPDRARELSQHTDFRIYTPGSTSGLPLSILRTFAAPKANLPMEDLNQKINATTTALLGLSGITAEPMQSREHVLVAQLLRHAWSNRRDLDLPSLINEILTPSIHTIGAYNLETFFPARDRLKFASQLNNMLASPMFSTWLQGEPLDLGSMLYRNGRPQHLIFYLAHLDDNQRMFVTTLLLEEMLGWTRRQSGTMSLRALLYLDEVFGYLPPHPGNPPSKLPLLTLLKEARAVGVGVLLATQNPVDLDYKALSNAGTWFVGKLQTEPDKARLLDGLESVAAEYGTRTDRGYLERVIGSLGNRVFLMHGINQGKPKLFQTRWALSFLRGPMTRAEVERCIREVKDRDDARAMVPVKLCNHCGADVPAGTGNRCLACGKNPWPPPNPGRPTTATPCATPSRCCRRT